MTMSGPADARYVAFLETISTLRPALHRYCARMTGSVTDGEDVVQESLFEAYRNLDQFDESRPLKPWLFRIAHNRCIDFLRRKGVRDEAEAAAATPEAVSPADPATLGVGKAVEHLIASLPPKERASILLKDVFDYSLEEIAELIDTSVGGVKAALNRARTKLASTPVSSSPASSQPAKTANPELLRIMRLYVDRFNRHDWDGVRELVSADATLTVADRFAGAFADAQYFFNYDRWPWPWKLAVGELDGEPVVIVLRGDADTRTFYSAIRMNVAAQKVERITDYIHCPWMIQAAGSVSLGETRASQENGEER
jgi:RNA polymerase sigma-70 factor (ECF subfamily)